LNSRHGAGLHDNKKGKGMRRKHGPVEPTPVGARRHGPAALRFTELPVAACAALLVLAGSPQDAIAAKPAPRPPAASSSFTDHFNAYDATRWSRADGWTNGSPFDNAWFADHVTVANGSLGLRLDDVAALGQPYSSGELRTNGYYGYGCYEASFKPIMVPGVVTSLFTFAGPYDNGGNGKHNEIDIEFLGDKPGQVQLNFWTNDDAYTSRNEMLLGLGFDPRTTFHRYGFKWTASQIEWYVDGRLVYTAFHSTSNPTPKATESLQKIMVNAWPVDETAALWAGTFIYPGTPLRAEYQWIRHIAGETCSLLEAPADVPPPSGSASTISVREIALSLDARATQVIARVSVVDGLGRPVAGAAVAGTWNGAITTGDTARTTDSTGTATFYSSRTRTPGLVQFCVANVSAAGLTYAPAANVEDCDAITK
jgi:beta-glucanase (GH16 family)